MKKHIVLGFYTLLSVGFLIFGLYYGLENTGEWMAIISGVIIMLLSIPIYQMGKTTTFLYYVTIIMNSMATGLVISAYYANAGEVPVLESSVQIGLFVTLMAIIGSVFAFHFKEKEHKKLTSFILVLFGYLITIPLWITLDDVFYSQLFFFMHTCYFLLIAIINLKEKENHLKSSALSTYGLFVVVSFIVLLVLSEGEALEGVGYFGDTGKKENIKTMDDANI